MSTEKKAPILTIDDYLASIPEAVRPALGHLRRTIQAAAPAATETISYQVPAFRHHGMLVSFGAAKNHCAFYVMSPATVEAFADDLKEYDTSKGTVRFSTGSPLPDDLVTRLVQARVAENEAKTSRKKKVR